MTHENWINDLDLSSSVHQIQVYTGETLANQIRVRAENQGRSESMVACQLMIEGLLALEDRSANSRSGEDEEESFSMLQNRVQELEERLAAAQKDTEAGTAAFDEADLRDRVLTDEYLTMEEIKHRIAETGLLDEALLNPLENQLWKLVAWDEATYQRGYGWKLVDNEVDQ
jgi:hypothetical protein